MQSSRLKFHGSISTRGEAAAHLKAPGDAVLIERGEPRWLLLKCPCGCGEVFSINLDPRSGPAWHVYNAGKTALSIYPSVWRENGCQSHYIIWRGRILLFDHHQVEFDGGMQSDEISALMERVLERLPRKQLLPFSEIATSLDAVPWDVLVACRQLVGKGLAREGRGKQSGRFCRAT